MEVMARTMAAERVDLRIGAVLYEDRDWNDENSESPAEEGTSVLRESSSGCDILFIRHLTLLTLTL
jgi:hypothetical protein